MKTFKYRLYPTVAQAAEIERQLAECARLYNGALQERQDAWRMRRKRVGYYDQSSQLKDIRAAGDLAIPSQGVAAEVLQRVDRAFRAFYRRVKAGEKPGYPRFRSARRYDSLTYRAGNRVRWFADARVALHGIGQVKVKLHRPLEGKIATLTVKRAAGRWYLYVACHVEPTPLPATGLAVGVDVGLTSLAVLSNGEAIENPRHFVKGQAALRVAHRRVARRPRGSSGRREAIRILQRTIEHVANQRRDFHHKIARSLVNRFDLIAVEDLNVKGLAGGMLAKSVHDAGWGQFLQLLSEKAESAARVVIAVNPAGTSQRCSACGSVVRKTLAQRWHSCPCGLEMDRDHNAALNILGAGMALAGETWPGDRVSVPAEADKTAIHALAGSNRPAYSGNAGGGVGGDLSET